MMVAILLCLAALAVSAVPAHAQLVFDATHYPGDYHVAAGGDLNGDGVADLVVANPFAETTRIYFNDGAGGLIGPTLAPFVERSVQIIDVNGDSRLDLVGTMGSGTATYALGNALSVQIWRVVEQELPDLDAQVESGEFGRLYESLRERLYRHGRKFTPMETLERAIGADAIDPQPYLEYLRQKVDSLRVVHP